MNSYSYIGRTCNIGQLQLFSSLPSGYECHTSVITELLTSQRGKDPAPARLMWLAHQGSETYTNPTWILPQ